VPWHGTAVPARALYYTLFCTEWQKVGYAEPRDSQNRLPFDERHWRRERGKERKRDEGRERGRCREREREIRGEREKERERERGREREARAHGGKCQPLHAKHYMFTATLHADYYTSC